MSKASSKDRLLEAGARAREAESRGDDARAGEEWRLYRLIEDASRDPDELLAKGIALSIQAAKLADLADLESAHGELPESRRHDS
jgi:hypothetical protein